MPLHPGFHKKISSKIHKQVPEFINVDHPTFVRFLEVYYEYMEQTGKPVEFIGQMNEYGDIDKTVDSFVAYFKKMFAEALPETLVTRKDYLIKHLRDFYRARGTEKSFQFLMRILFNDEITISYPGEKILKTSDGKWTNQKYIKVLYTSTTFDLLGRKITGATTGATAYCEEMLLLQEGINQVVEIQVSHVKGTFSVGETISGTDREGNTVSLTVGGTITGITITAPGSDYSIGDDIVITGGGGGAVNMAGYVGALVKNGTITGTSITSAGTGYLFGQYVPLINTNTLSIDGTTAAIRISKVDGMINTLSISNAGDKYIYAPDLVFSGGGGSGAIATAELDSPGIAEITVDNGGSGYTYAIIEINGGGREARATATIVAGVITAITVDYRGRDYSTAPRIIIRGDGTGAAATAVVGSTITKVNIVNRGQGYTSAPSIAVTPKPGDTTGTGGVVVPTIIGTSGDGRIVELTIENAGKGYYGIPLANLTGVGDGNATVTLSSTTIDGIARINFSQRGFGLTANPTIDLTGIGDGLATATATYGSVFEKDSGFWVGTDGQLSSDKVLQDNYYYQDFSYVVENSGQSLDFWSDVLKNILHPAGMQFFGEMRIGGLLDLSMGAISTTLNGRASHEYNIVFPILDVDNVAQAIVTIEAVDGHVTLEITSMAENDGLQKQLPLMYKNFDMMKFFTQGGYSENNTGASALTGIEINDGGSGYTNASLPLIFTGGGGSGAAGTATMTAGVVTSITITNYGSGYTSPPAISLDDSPFIPTTNAILYASIESGAGGYNVGYLNSLFNYVPFTIGESPYKKMKIAPGAYIELEKSA